MLSREALTLFRLQVELHGKILINDTNRGPYRELERAGLMVLGIASAAGRVRIDRVSKLGFERRPNCWPLPRPCPIQSPRLVADRKLGPGCGLDRIGMLAACPQLFVFVRDGRVDAVSQPSSSARCGLPSGP